jgi:hypothetical protein
MMCRRLLTFLMSFNPFNMAPHTSSHLVSNPYCPPGGTASAEEPLPEPVGSMAEFAARLGISPGEFAVVREQMCGRLAADLIDDVAYLRLIVSRLSDRIVELEGEAASGSVGRP